ncbi:MAG: hypothetical protein ACPGQS_14790 [Bradymonadia bacterium]
MACSVCDMIRSRQAALRPFGDGVLQEAEACEGGNTTEADGCDGLCSIESPAQSRSCIISPPSPGKYIANNALI